MNCEKAKELLWGYYRQELTADEAAELEQHLEGCADCQEEAEFCREMVTMLNALSEEELPEGYHTELMQKLEKAAKTVETDQTEWAVIPFKTRRAEQQKKQKEQKSRQKKQQKFRQWGMAAAAAVLVASSGTISGLWEQQKQHRHDVMYEGSYEAESAETENVTDTAVMPIAEETAAEQNRTAADTAAENTQIHAAQQQKAKKEAPAGGKTEAEPMQKAEESQITAEPMIANELQEVPQTTAYTPEEAVPMMSREMQTEEVAGKETSEIVSLKVTEEESTKAAIRKQLMVLGGKEEAAENGMAVLLPPESVAAFYEVLEEIGELSWIQTSGAFAGDAEYCRIEIQLLTE